MPWRDLPREFGAWQTVHRRFQAWSADGTLDRVLAVLVADADATGQVEGNTSVDSTIARAHQHAATARRSVSGPSSHTGGAVEDKNSAVGRDEPDDHGLGRSRGGLSTKSHALVDGLGRLLTLIVGPGQAGDCPVLPLLLGELRVARRGPGRPRTTPASVRADKAYTSRANRELLRARGITAVIPERADQIANRQRQGSAGGRPASYDVEDYQGRNVVERFFNRVKHWRGIASRYDKHAVNYRGGILLAAIVDWLKNS